ncbi:MAG: putative alpha/beta hydrolase family esterase [Ilumatobacter sp.]|jgi:predicted alpha/beta hydrolase family esterase
MPETTGPPPSDPVSPTALEALRPLATSEVAVTDTLRHREVYTSRGLLSVLWHEPSAPVPAALVMCGGAMGGLLGPGHGLYQHWGDRWAERGVRVLRVGYREPNNLDLCAHDLACGVEWARDAGAERVVVMGHSFGGAVAIRAAVVMTGSVAGVVTFATQSAGCEVAAALTGRPLLLFHGDRDEILPPESSHMVQAIAGHGDVVMLPGDGHLLAKSDDILTERLDAWLPGVLGLG